MKGRSYSDSPPDEKFHYASVFGTRLWVGGGIVSHKQSLAFKVVLLMTGPM